MNAEETTSLIRAVKEGSPEAFDLLYERYAARLLALVRLRMGRDLRGQLESRDVLQACLIKVLERVDELQNPGAGSFMAWFARIAENEIRDQARYHHRGRRDARRNVPAEEADEVTARMRSALSQVILGEEAERVERALERLPGHYREVIVLRKLEERDWAEIASSLGRSEDACRMLLARAMTALTLEMDSRE